MLAAQVKSNQTLALAQDVLKLSQNQEQLAHEHASTETELYRLQARAPPEGRARRPRAPATRARPADVARLPESAERPATARGAQSRRAHAHGGLRPADP